MNTLLPLAPATNDEAAVGTHSQERVQQARQVRESAGEALEAFRMLTRRSGDLIRESAAWSASAAVDVIRAILDAIKALIRYLMSLFSIGKPGAKAPLQDPLSSAAEEPAGLMDDGSPLSAAIASLRLDRMNEMLLEASQQPQLYSTKEAAERMLSNALDVMSQGVQIAQKHRLQFTEEMLGQFDALTLTGFKVVPKPAEFHAMLMMRKAARGDLTAFEEEFLQGYSRLDSMVTHQAALAEAGQNCVAYAVKAGVSLGPHQLALEAVMGSSWKDRLPPDVLAQAGYPEDSADGLPIPSGAQSMSRQAAQAASSQFLQSIAQRAAQTADGRRDSDAEAPRPDAPLG